METRTIITADGDEKEVSGERITEFGGTVIVWHEWPDSAAEALVNPNCDKYEGASLA